MEQLRVALARDALKRTVSSHNLVSDDRLLNQSVPVTRRLHAEAHRKTPGREVFHLDHDFERVAHRHEVSGELAHVHEGLHPDDHPLGVDFEHITQGDLDVVAVLLIGRRSCGHGQPRGPRRAHRFLGPRSTPLAHLFLHASHAFVVLLGRCAKTGVEHVSRHASPLEQEARGQGRRGDDQAAVVGQPLTRAFCELRLSELA